MSEFRKVQPGTPMQISAATWNEMLDMLAWYKQQKNKGGAGLSKAAPTPCYIWVKNNTEADRGRFDIVQIEATDTSIFPLPSDNLAGFQQGPHFRGIAPSSTGNDRLAVLAEPIKDGAIGRAIVCGATPVQIDIQSAGENYATTEVDNCDNLISSDDGPVWILWGNHNTGVSWCYAVLGVSMYLPGTTTQSVVTDFQVDTTNRLFQVKTRLIEILSNNTDPESGWTTKHTGTACP